ncbi:MAG: VOC family protein [Leptospiraceae bacterium]|nr:VOC family protein [Leptospiraceae bacterium]
MKRIIINLCLIAIAFSLITCREKETKLNSYVSIIEIPATDMNRAIDFYQSILGIKIEKLDFPEYPDMQLGLLPQEGQQVVGVLIKGDGYAPSSKGVTVYLNAGENLQAIVENIPKQGGKVLVPKSPHADGVGFYAIFLDTEGNRLGLHSPN